MQQQRTTASRAGQASLSEAELIEIERLADRAAEQANEAIFALRTQAEENDDEEIDWHAETDAIEPALGKIPILVSQLRAKPSGSAPVIDLVRPRLAAAGIEP